MQARDTCRLCRTYQRVVYVIAEDGTLTPECEDFEACARRVEQQVRS